MEKPDPKLPLWPQNASGARSNSTRWAATTALPPCALHRQQPPHRLTRRQSDAAVTAQPITRSAAVPQPAVLEAASTRAHAVVNTLHTPLHSRSSRRVVVL